MIAFNQTISVIAICFSGFSLLIAVFSIWISWKNYTKFTKEQLQDKIKQELQNQIEKLKYRLIDKKKWNFFIENKNKNDFYQNYYQVFRKWKKWRQIKKWEPILLSNNKDLNNLEMKTNSKKRNLEFIIIKGTTDWHNYEKNPKKIIFEEFYTTFTNFLKVFFEFDFTEQNYHEGKLHDFSQIFFSKKICKRLDQLFNHKYK